MPRPLRHDYPGAIHHVINRGARKQAVFVHTGVCLLFLECLEETVQRYAIRVLAFALMPNHWHLLVESVHGNLAEAMQFLKGEFGRRLNSMNDWDGPIWSGRYFNKVVESEPYLKYLFYYLANNPVSAGLCRDFDDADWTSHAYHGGQAEAPAWLTDIAEPLFGGPDAYCDYLARCLAGEIEAPDRWDPHQLESPHPTGSLPRSRTPIADQLDEAVREVETLLERSIRELGATRLGRRGNVAGCVAAWWLAESTIAPNVRGAERMGISAQAFGKRVRRARELRERHAAARHWMRLLEGSGAAERRKQQAS